MASPGRKRKGRPSLRKMSQIRCRYSGGRASTKSEVNLRILISYTYPRKRKEEGAPRPHNVHRRNTVIRIQPLSHRRICRLDSAREEVRVDLELGRADGEVRPEVGPNQKSVSPGVG